LPPTAPPTAPPIVLPTVLPAVLPTAPPPDPTIPPLLPTPSHRPQLTPEHVVDTIRRFGRHYDKRLIYDQIRTTLSQICKSHTLREIYITKYDSLDERLAEKLSE
jgi:hypothetical protein